MVYLREEKERGNTVGWMIKVCLFLAFIIGLTYMGLYYYRPFHIMVEAFSSFIAFSIFIIAINSYDISENIPFLFLGIGFGFAGGFNIIHLIASNGMGFFQGDTTNLSMIFSSIARYVSAISILVCCQLFNKSYKMITPTTIILIFSAFTAGIWVLIFRWSKFPACYIPGYGVTSFKIITEYIFSAISLLCVVVVFKGKKYIETNVYLLLQYYLCATILSSILLNFYTAQQEITNVGAHILKLISAYCIYRAIIKIGIRTPYKLLFNEIKNKNHKLEQKDLELNQAVDELKKENQLRKNIEELFMKNEACYKLLIENSQNNIVIYNYERIIFANKGAASIIGIKEHEKLLGKCITEFFPFYSEQRLLEMIKEKGNEEVSTIPYETQVTGVNGENIDVEIVSAYVVYQNEPAILSLITDISQNKQIEKMTKDIEKNRKLLNETLEFNGLIKEFFSNISHELRTPLNVILSALQVLSFDEQKSNLDDLAEKRVRYFKIMKQNCFRLLKLINNLIDISKIDSGYLEPNLKNYNIVSIVEDTTLSVAEYIQGKGIEFIFDTDVEEKVIACDPHSIERIMMNLLSNAVKFTDVGGQIFVAFMDKGDYIEISVKDTGTGIPEDKLQVIFDRFRQVDNSLSRSHEGSGIGLSLVKELVDMHRGDIYVKSKLGTGSEFIIKLPARKMDDSEVIEKDILIKDNGERISVEFSDL